jgi:hypothetical protein
MLPSLPPFSFSFLLRGVFAKRLEFLDEFYGFLWKDHRERERCVRSDNGDGCVVVRGSIITRTLGSLCEAERNACPPGRSLAIALYSDTLSDRWLRLAPGQIIPYSYSRWVSLTFKDWTPLPLAYCVQHIVLHYWLPRHSSIHATRTLRSRFNLPMWGEVSLVAPQALYPKWQMDSLIFPRASASHGGLEAACASSTSFLPLASLYVFQVVMTTIERWGQCPWRQREHVPIAVGVDNGFVWFDSEFNDFQL